MSTTSTSTSSIGRCRESNTYVDTFKAFTHLRDQGRIRSIGVSNFEPEHLRILVDATGIVPAVNQIELHPLLQQQEFREVHAQLGVATEAWSPLGQGSLLEQPDRDRASPRRTEKRLRRY